MFPCSLCLFPGTLSSVTQRFCSLHKKQNCVMCLSLHFPTSLSQYLMPSHHNLAEAGRFAKPLGELCDITNNYFLPLELKETLRPIKWTRPIARCPILPRALAGLALYHSMINVGCIMFFGRKINEEFSHI